MHVLVLLKARHTKSRIVRSLWLAALLSLSIVATAGAISVRTVVHGAEAPGPQSVTVRARSLGKATQPVEVQITVPGESKIDVGEGLWELAVDSPALWSNRKIVPADSEVTLDLWPSATVTGTLPKMTPPVTELSVAFSEGQSACSVDGAEWKCFVPGGLRDLRFGSPGYASVHRWAVQLPAGRSTPVGSLRMIRGAAVSGYVSTERGVEAEMAEVRVTAVPRSTESGGGKSGGRHTAVPNARGFFQIAGIDPGEYVLSARGRTTRSVDTVVRILKDRNAELRSPLLLDVPKQISLGITPPLAPDGSRWRVDLLRLDVDANRLDTITTGRTAEDGSWSHEAVAGEYLVQVGESDDAVWSSQTVHVAAAGVALRIEVHPLRITGKVTLGDRPIPARVIFGGRMKAKRKTVVADDEGKYSALVPLRGQEEWEVDIENDVPPIQRTLTDLKPSAGDDGNLRLDIRLPSSSIAGRVVDADGSPASGAIVTLDSDERRDFQQVFTATDGSFELFGFPAGFYRIKASAYLAVSDVMPVTVAEGQAPPVELVLRPETRVKGKVIADSTPVIGARIAALPRDAKAITIPTATSNEVGLFSLGLPPGTRTFDVLVTGFGFAATMGRSYVGERKMVLVGVDRQGGQLVLRVPPKGDARLLHGGGEYDVRWLAGETRGTIAQHDEREVVTLPDLEQGDYRLCVETRCTSGVLAAGGSLTLTVER